MIVHNLSHAIYESSYQASDPIFQIPGLLSKEESRNLWYYLKFKSDLVKESPLGYKKEKDLEDMRQHWVYPTTRSFKNNKIPNQSEAFHEVFTQWVVSGRITFDPDTEKTRELAKKLGTEFRKDINRLQQEGKVLYN